MENKTGHHFCVRMSERKMQQQEWSLHWFRLNDNTKLLLLVCDKKSVALNANVSKNNTLFFHTYHNTHTAHHKRHQLKYIGRRRVFLWSNSSRLRPRKRTVKKNATHRSSSLRSLAIIPSKSAVHANGNDAQVSIRTRRRQKHVKLFRKSKTGDND